MSGLEPPNGQGRQPSPAPDSTLARNFSEQLDGVFNLGGEIPDLTQSVEDKRQLISTQSRELQELEARLKAAESKLQQAGGQRVPSGSSQPRKDVRELFPEAPSSNGASSAAATKASESAKAQAAAEQAAARYK